MEDEVTYSYRPTREAVSDFADWLAANLKRPEWAANWIAHAINEIEFTERGGHYEIGRFHSRDGNPVTYQFGPADMEAEEVW